MFQAKNADILFTAIPAFEILLGATPDQQAKGKKYEMPRRGSTKLNRLLPAVQEAAKQLSKDRADIMDKYVEKDSQGNPVIEGSALKCKSVEDRHAFEREMSELMNDTTEFLGEPFYPEDLPDPLDPSIMPMLGTFFVDKELAAEQKEADKKKAQELADKQRQEAEAPPQTA